MQILHKALPPIWALRAGELPAPAREAAAALLELATDAATDADPPLAQLGASPDATAEALALGLQLRQLLARVAVVAGELQEATT